MTKPRSFRVGYAHHVYNRGNQKENIFFCKKDYRVFIKYLNLYCNNFDCNLLISCLMPNHFHLLLQPMKVDSIPLLMHRITTLYSRYLRESHNWTGHIFQGRYNSKIIKTKDYLDDVIKYIENNPYDANLIMKNERYKWLKVNKELITLQQNFYTPG